MQSAALIRGSRGNFRRSGRSLSAVFPGEHRQQPFIGLVQPSLIDLLLELRLDDLDSGGGFRQFFFKVNRPAH